ncbi:hypothetical protein DFJ58DRAFT_721767 [Suillus subalutaceus]|uniref:uncharacterized protein n=1 Tax=Suillus subalutaceus TaxID=48586 RepID=UPI001B872E41|nr:uncharacterized protein DFJ58DRAFT_721767 [Suillus subalutaceus]KAG1874772.1 hypothetical protein DFJ58DRAFT_721767 [Suillus subalutaceus]
MDNASHSVCDLPLSSQITFTVWDIGAPRIAVPVGGSTFRMFGKKCHRVRTLRPGKHRLLLWAVKKQMAPYRPRHKVNLAAGMKWFREAREEIKSDWLHNMVFGKMEETYDRSQRIYVDLPRFDFPVVFRESATIPFAPVLPSCFATDPYLWGILDPESAHENPVEDKHCQLVQSHRSSPDELNQILDYAPSSLSFRGERLHLEVPLLPSTGQAWAYQVPQTEVDTDDTLELLGPGTVDLRVKAFVIRQFNHADDEVKRRTRSLPARHRRLAFGQSSTSIGW